MNQSIEWLSCAASCLAMKSVSTPLLHLTPNCSSPTDQSTSGPKLISRSGPLTVEPQMKTKLRRSFLETFGCGLIVWNGNKIVHDFGNCNDELIHRSVSVALEILGIRSRGIHGGRISIPSALVDGLDS